MAIRIRDEFANRETAQDRFAELWALREFVDVQVRRIVRDPHEAEDLTQDTYIRVLAVLETLDNHRPAAPYLATVARNLARNEVRRRRRLQAVEDVPEPSTNRATDPAHLVEAAEACRRVLDALAELPAHERNRVLASALDGLTPTQIAEAEGSTSGAVRTSLMRARAKLRLVTEWAGAPVTSLLAWIRRRDPDTGLRLQHSTATAGQVMTERVAQVVAVAGAAVTLSVMPLPRVSDAGAVVGPTARPSIELAQVAAHGEVVEPLSHLASVPHGRATAPPDQPIALQPAYAAEAAGGSPEGSAPDATPAPDAWADPTVLAPSGAPVDPANPGGPGDAPAPIKRQPATIPAELFLVGNLASASPETGHLIALGEVRSHCAGSCLALFASRDGGESWMLLPAAGLSETITSVAVAPGFPSDPRIFASGAVLQVSRDGGKTFETVPGPKGPLAVSPQFSTGDPRVLAGGAPTWAFNADTGVAHPGAITPLFGTEQRLAFLDAHTVLAGTMIPEPGGPNRPAVATCVDGQCGVPVRLPLGIGPPDVAVIGSQVWAWTAAGPSVSIDGGATFSTVTLPLTGTVTAVTGAGNRIHVAMDNIDGWTHKGAILISLDAGQTWTITVHDAFERGLRALAVTGGGRIVAAPSAFVGGLLCSSDDGRSWAETCAA